MTQVRIAISCTCFPLACDAGECNASPGLQGRGGGADGAEAGLERQRLYQLLTKAPLAIDLLRDPDLRFEFANPLLKLSQRAGASWWGRRLLDAVQTSRRTW